MYYQSTNLYEIHVHIKVYSDTIVVTTYHVTIYHAFTRSLHAIDIYSIQGLKIQPLAGFIPYRDFARI